MGASHGDFVKYPRTPHLFGSRGTDDDKHLSAKKSLAFISDESLIVEEKLDGTNIGIHFTSEGRMVLQNRGHEITTAMHPQYDLFKQWVYCKRPILEVILEDRWIMFGEWLYAKHTIYYRQLPHYFFEFDIYDKQTEEFLTFEERTTKLADTGILTVPILHEGALSPEELADLIGPSAFDSEFEHPETKMIDHLMEGLYLRTESETAVTGRAKFVRPEFVEKIKQSEHWQHQQMVPNVLAEDAEIWS